GDPPAAQGTRPIRIFGSASAIALPKARPGPTPAAGLSQCSGSTAGAQAWSLPSMNTRGCGVRSSFSTLPRPAMLDWPTRRYTWKVSLGPTSWASASSSANSMASSLRSVPQHPARAGPGVLAVVDRDHAVDDHDLDSDGILERLEVRRLVDHAVRVEDREVREGARLHHAAVLQADLLGVERRHLADGVFELEQVLLADVDAEHARERPEAARVRTAAAQRALDGVREAVGADRAPGLRHRERHVLLGVVRVDRRDRAVLLDQEIEKPLDRVGGRVPRREDPVHRLALERAVLRAQVAVDEHAAPVAAHRRV